MGLATHLWNNVTRRRLRYVVDGMHAIFVETLSLVKISMYRHAMQARTHTGRRRNDATRAAILTAAAELLETQDSANITMVSIAQRAGAGKQTLYRWWPTKGALLLEAMVALAESEVPGTETQELRTDLMAFVRRTFAAATKHRSLLLGVLREALGDTETATELDDFAASRRAVLRELIEAAAQRGEIDDGGPIDVVVDEVFGLLWYRLIFQNAPLTKAVAVRLVDGVLAQLSHSVAPRASEATHTR
jgi:AcrR family transcriptional regulator